MRDGKKLILGHRGEKFRGNRGGVGMQKVRLNLYQADREFQLEISACGSGYRLFGPKFDGSSRLIKSVILSDRDKEEIVGYVKPDAKAIEEERDELKSNLHKAYSDESVRRYENYTAISMENDRLKADLAEARNVLIGWLTFAADVKVSDFVGLEWLNVLRDKSKALAKEP